jgi:uncharacterized protein YacL
VKRSETLARRVGLGIGAVGGFVLGYALVLSSRAVHPGWVLITLTTVEGLIFAYLGTPYVLGGWRGFNLRLTSTPLSDLLSGLLGLMVGLVIAVLIGVFVNGLVAQPYGYIVSAVLALLLAAQGASVGLTRRAELAALFFGGGNEQKGHRLSGVLLDTSVIIDGRILDIAKTGFVDIPLIILSSVLRELQQVADSADATRRRRGRRGLDVLTEMQKDPAIQLQVVDDDDAAPNVEIDAHLVRTAKRKGWGIMTNDFNLNRIARLEGVTVLNLNELAQAMRPVAIPGEEIVVMVAREGKEPGQGVGSLDDGTMVVIQNGRRMLNQTITAVVTSVIQTSAGRMIFAEPAGMDGRRGPRNKGDGG